MTDRQLRARILQFAEKVVLHQCGTVSAYGIMPNSNVTGWYFVGTAKVLKHVYSSEGKRP